MNAVLCFWEPSGFQFKKGVKREQTKLRGEEVISLNANNTFFMSNFDGVFFDVTKLGNIFQVFKNFWFLRILRRKLRKCHF